MEHTLNQTGIAIGLLQKSSGKKISTITPSNYDLSNDNSNILSSSRNRSNGQTVHHLFKTRQHFYAIKQALHFNDPSVNQVLLHKVDPVINHVKKNCLANFIPGKNLSYDEADVGKQSVCNREYRGVRS